MVQDALADPTEDAAQPGMPVVRADDQRVEVKLAA